MLERGMHQGASLLHTAPGTELRFAAVAILAVVVLYFEKLNPFSRKKKTAAKQALDDNKTHYVTNAGIAPLRRAIAAKYQHQLSFPCTEDHVMVAFGGMGAIFLALVGTKMLLG